MNDKFRYRIPNEYRLSNNFSRELKNLENVFIYGPVKCYFTQVQAPDNYELQFFSETLKIEEVEEIALKEIQLHLVSRRFYR